MSAEADSTRTSTAPAPVAAEDVDIDALLDEAERLVHAAGRELAGDLLTDVDDVPPALDEAEGELPSSDPAPSDDVATAPAPTPDSEIAQLEAPAITDSSNLPIQVSDSLDDMPPATETVVAPPSDQPVGVASTIEAEAPTTTDAPVDDSAENSTPTSDRPPAANKDAALDDERVAPSPDHERPSEETTPEAGAPDAEATSTSSTPPELLTTESSPITSASDATPAESGGGVPRRGLAVRALLAPLWLLAGLFFVLNLPFARLSDDTRRVVGLLAIGTAIMAAVAWLLPALVR